MAHLTLKNIGKIYPGNVQAVSDFNLEIEDREFIVFVGPSGCGKSTTLRMIAGLEDITQGELFIGDQLMNDVEPGHRDIAMVFQNYALYPHMTVYDNMAFGLKIRKVPKDEIKRKVEEAARILDISHLLKRKPKALSGGERQRVALGRAIIREPQVFLLDEPLSNLDAKLRAQMRTEISGLHRRLGTTFIYVTHDQTEAMTMGDRICVMKDGLIQQVDTPQNLYNNPSNMFVAGFISSPPMNFIEATVRRALDAYFVEFDNFAVKLPPEKAADGRLDGYLDRRVVIGIRPEHIAYNVGTPDGALTATIEVTEMMGADTNLHLKCGSSLITARVSTETTAVPGNTVQIAFTPRKIHLFDNETLLTII